MNALTLSGLAIWASLVANMEASVCGGLSVVMSATSTEAVSDSSSWLSASGLRVTFDRYSFLKRSRKVSSDRVLATNISRPET